VIETGTFLGTGSTRIILEAFGTEVPEKFYTIEIEPTFYERARQNLASFKYVEVLWGLSVDTHRAEQFINHDPLLVPGEAARRNLLIENPADPRSFYLSEIRAGVQGYASKAPDRWLELLLNRHRTATPLIALDSAGGIGWLEFCEVIRIMKGYKFLLFLDDINHVKHHRSLRYILSHPDFDLLDYEMKDGWLVAISRPVPKFA